MGLIQNLKDALNPKSYDRSDPEGVKKAMAPHQAVMNSGLGKVLLPASLRERMETIVDQSSKDSATMWRMLEERKAQEAAAAHGAAPPPPAPEK